MARAVVREARRIKLSLPPISRVDFIVTHGVSAAIDGENVLVGSRHFVAEDEGVDCRSMEDRAAALRRQEKSLRYVARAGEIIRRSFAAALMHNASTVGILGYAALAASRPLENGASKRPVPSKEPSPC